MHGYVAKIEIYLKIHVSFKCSLAENAKSGTVLSL